MMFANIWFVNYYYEQWYPAPRFEWKSL